MNQSILLASALAALLAVPVHSETITGRVVAVSDGDTITVLDRAKIQHKIRLTGTDAPAQKQAFGQRAKEPLSDLAYSGEVQVEATKKDRYRREIGTVLGDGLGSKSEGLRVALQGLPA